MPDPSTLSVSELFSAAQPDYLPNQRELAYDADPALNAIRELQRRNTSEVFEQARDFCSSTVARERERALDALSQLGSGRPDAERPFLDASVELAALALNDPDAGVRSSAAGVLSHLRTGRALEVLLGQLRSPEEDVRFAVAFGFGGCTEDAYIAALIELTKDPADDVRDWAFFGFGLSSADTPEIRDALRIGLHDSFEEARLEALWALAQRKDPEGLRSLIGNLEQNPTRGDEYAAEEILGLRSYPGDEEAIRGLRALLSSGPHPPGE